ncbi:Forkhead box protein J3 [Tulasnella sp. 330]|nr:Forkhead box protein J3 [Tulasnella sp. 330]KAG8888591.1 Forkhead box protein J3 [Tulasnella sp. 332]
MSLNDVRNTKISALGRQSPNSGHSSNYSPPSPTSSTHETPAVSIDPASAAHWVSSSPVGVAEGLASPSAAPSRRQDSEPDNYRGLTLADLADSGPGKDPGYSKRALIQVAIQSSPNQRLRQSEIREAIMERFPFFRTAGKTWQNSLRHALSNNKCFYNVPKPAREPGRGSYWAYEFAPKPREMARPNPARRVRADRPASLPRRRTDAYVSHDHDVTPFNERGKSSYSEAEPLSDPYPPIPLPSSNPTPTYLPDLPLLSKEEIAGATSRSPYLPIDPRFLSSGIGHPSMSPAAYAPPLFTGNPTTGGFFSPSTTIEGAPLSTTHSTTQDTLPVFASPSRLSSSSHQQVNNTNLRYHTRPGHQQIATTSAFFASPSEYGHASESPSQLQPQPQPYVWPSTGSHQYRPHTYHRQRQHQQFHISPSVTIADTLGDVGSAELSSWTLPSSLPLATADGLPNQETNSAGSSSISAFDLRALPSSFDTSTWQGGPVPSLNNGGGPGASRSSDSTVYPPFNYDVDGTEQWLDAFPYEWNNRETSSSQGAGQ